MRRRSSAGRRRVRLDANAIERRAVFGLNEAAASRDNRVVRTPRSDADALAQKVRLLFDWPVAKEVLGKSSVRIKIVVASLNHADTRCSWRLAAGFSVTTSGDSQGRASALQRSGWRRLALL